MYQNYLTTAFALSAVSLFAHEPQVTTAANLVGCNFGHTRITEAAVVAEQPNPDQPISSDITDFSRLQFGANYTYVHITTPGYSATHGNLGGLQALYEYRRPDHIYGGLAFTWRQGDTDGSGRKRSIVDINIQERIGYTFCSDDDLLISLFSGFGYRRLGETDTTPAGSVKFNYNDLYIPVGLLLDKQINARFWLGLNLQWMPEVYPTVTIVPLKGARWKTAYRLNNVLIEIPFTVTPVRGSHYSLMFLPFIEWWSDGKTSAVAEDGERLLVPTISYVFAGLKANFCYSF